jgi:hypothetical protein
MATKLTPAQVTALELLRAAGGGLDYRPELYAFALPGAARSGRVVMGTAKSLIAAGLVHATRTKPMRGKDVPDRLELAPSPEPCATPGPATIHKSPNTSSIDPCRESSMPDKLKELLETIPQQPQRQDSTRAQLADLHAFANRLGLYDAADAIKAIVGRQ